MMVQNSKQSSLYQKKESKNAEKYTVAKVVN